MQPYPVKGYRALPDGWDEKDTRKAMSEFYDSLLGEFTDDNGVLKVTPDVIKKVINESR
jgi:hypothetical protein